MLLSFLAKTVGVKQTQVVLVSGEKSRDKTVRVVGVTVAQVREIDYLVDKRVGGKRVGYDPDHKIRRRV